MAILAIGALTTRTYDPTDLQAFAHGIHGGRYWFTNGWNAPAVAAWALGATFGILAVNTTPYVGPLADLAGGVDVSTAGSAALAGLMYLVARGSRLRVACPRLGKPLVQSLADVLRRIGVATTLVARDHHTTGHHTGDTRQPNPLPDAAHAQSVPKLRT